MSFEGKVILITGGGGGIGAGAARHLTKLGTKVSIVDRNEQRLNDVAEEIKNSGSPTPTLIIADVTKDAKRIVNETIEKLGKLYVLINNIGFGRKDTVVDVNLSEFDQVIDTNVRSVINLTKLCVPYLEKTKGNIVNVSSVCGLKPVRNFTSYSMSKAALNQFTKCSALDLASKGIRVNSINPSAVRTKCFETLGMSLEQYDQMLHMYAKVHPAGRVGQVADTSAAIPFLANNETASFLTGILLPVDGGFVIA